VEDGVILGITGLSCWALRRRSGRAAGVGRQRLGRVGAWEQCGGVSGGTAAAALEAGRQAAAAALGWRRRLGAVWLD
jgi:hypothetical protein